MEVQYIDFQQYGGQDEYKNPQLLDRQCQDDKTALDCQAVSLTMKQLN
ncbi:hypothetical protein [Microcystis aeruginosa]|uniref:Uncharacterized protein n=1 Tax=Microcystis aeruginosa PCC 9443 TaxID=1160281 RepID=I4G6N4_MICAE|nr:hypothetical protein [Microcystis aeruginosa]CCI03595.1 hypothetical protein MICAC_4730006 [Microcystis aeruginosa PCC 9443]